MDCALGAKTMFTHGECQLPTPGECLGTFMIHLSDLMLCVAAMSHRIHTALHQVCGS